MTPKSGDTTHIPGVGHVSNNEILMTGLNCIMAGTVGFLVDGLMWAIMAALIMLAVPLVPIAIAKVRTSLRMLATTKRAKQYAAEIASQRLLALAGQVRSIRTSCATILAPLGMLSLPLRVKLGGRPTDSIRKASRSFIAILIAHAPVALPLLAILSVAAGTALYGIEIAFYSALLLVPIMLGILLTLVVTD